jgi:hypothetical protein
MGEYAIGLLEGMRVLRRHRAVRGIADVSDESAGLELARLPSELLVLVGGQRLLEDLRMAA